MEGDTTAAGLNVKVTTSGSAGTDWAWPTPMVGSPPVLAKATNALTSAGAPFKSAVILSMHWHSAGVVYFDPCGSVGERTVLRPAGRP